VSGRSISVKGLFHHIDSKFLRFIIVGVINTLFGLGVYCLCIFLGIPYYVATVISNVAGVLFNFVTTGNLVFENGDKRLFGRFVACYVLVYIINTLLIKLLLVFGINDYYAGIIATPVVALCSYGLLKNFVYNDKHRRL
jgi:putative flippase GtrA